MVSNYQDWEFFYLIQNMIGSHYNFSNREMMKLLFSFIAPCALSDSYVCTTLIPPLTVKAP